LVSLYDFENRDGIFPGVHRSYKFCLLTLSSPARPAERAEFVFFAHQVEHLQEEQRRFSLTAEEIALLNPNTRTCPVFRSRRDAQITLGIYRRVPVLVKEGPPEENPWGIRFTTLFHMANDSHLFRTRAQLQAEGWQLRGNVFVRRRAPKGGRAGDEDRCLPLYEAKMIHHYDHRWATYEGDEVRNATEREKQDPSFTVLPRYWVAEDEVLRRLDLPALPAKAGQPGAARHARWLLGFRDIARSTDERTGIFAIIPATAVGHKLPLLFSEAPPCQKVFFIAMLSSFAFDFVSRQKVGGTSLGYYVLRQLPVVAAMACRTEQTAFAVPRVIELLYTAWDLQPFARDCGYDGPPFRWDEARRFLLRCELDAAFFHLYAIARDDVDYIMDTFPIVRRKDEAAFGEYRTKRVILEMYDQMQAAIDTGRPYQTWLDPPPADPRMAHPGSWGARHCAP
ncbi:MAG: Eco57I restriction-modification methylase domain-containing protein, partial [Anaerolineae bacterium]